MSDPPVLCAKETVHPNTIEYAAILEQFVSNGQVDYSALNNDREPLDEFVSSLNAYSKFVYEEWDQLEKIAFWINAYNAITLQVILDHYPITKKSGLTGFPFPTSSIRQIPGAWTKIKHLVFDRHVTLDEMEHDILRKDFNEPRLHMALVCAAKGCPPLRAEPYEGRRLSAQLDDQVRKFLSKSENFKINRERQVVSLSPIFSWFGEDFERKFQGSVTRANLPRAERSIVAFIREYVTKNDQHFLDQENYGINYSKYDWSLNDQVREPEIHE
jgi:hypothetical protein